MGDSGTPPSGSKRGRQNTEENNVAMPQCRSVVRRRNSSSSPSQGGLSTADVYTFLVYLPNSTSVEVKVDGATCRNLTVQGFVERVRIEQSLNIDANSKQKQQREIKWKNKVYITDFQGNSVADRRGVFTSLGDEFKAGRGLLLHVSRWKPILTLFLLQYL